MPIRPIDLEQFIEKTGNIHEAIVAASKRARQINEEMKIEFNQRIETIQQKVDTETPPEETEVNPDQLRIAAEFEKRPKPPEVALQELAEGDLGWWYREKEQIALVREEPEVEATDEDEEK